MEICPINQSITPMPKKHLTELITKYEQILSKKKVLKKGQFKELTIVFMNEKAAKELNKSFRKKNYATDILSFPPSEPGSLGELVLCPQVLKAQAKEQGWSFKKELSYMILHGMLHLFGYDHEKNKKEAQIMFELQDQVFALAFAR